MLRTFSAAPVEVEQLPSPLSLVLGGQWVGLLAGGPVTMPTFGSNPQYMISVPQRSQVGARVCGWCCGWCMWLVGGWVVGPGGAQAVESNGKAFLNGPASTDTAFNAAVRSPGALSRKLRAGAYAVTPAPTLCYCTTCQPTTVLAAPCRLRCAAPQPEQSEVPLSLCGTSHTSRLLYRRS